jgi:hypothetical protein
MDRIRGLVAERRRLEREGSTERLRANQREVTRLQRRLASMVKRELTQ